MIKPQKKLDLSNKRTFKVESPEQLEEANTAAVAINLGRSEGIVILGVHKSQQIPESVFDEVSIHVSEIYDLLMPYTQPKYEA